MAKSSFYGPGSSVAEVPSSFFDNTEIEDFTSIQADADAAAAAAAAAAASATASAASATVERVTSISFIIDGGGSTITSGLKGFIQVPFNATIQEVELLANQTGSIVVDIWKDTYANYPPTIADTITASARPTISSAVKSQDTTLTGWTTHITAGDVLAFNVVSVTSIQRVTVALKALRTS